MDPMGLFWIPGLRRGARRSPARTVSGLRATATAEVPKGGWIFINELSYLDVPGSAGNWLGLMGYFTYL